MWAFFGTQCRLTEWYWHCRCWCQTCRLLVVMADEHIVSDSGASSSSSSDTATTAGVIVIAVVICVVVTSLVWFLVIYKSRRRHSPTPFRPADSMTACDVTCHRTMSSVSDVDGSAQRLLACSSSHADFLHTSMLSLFTIIHGVWRCHYFYLSVITALQRHVVGIESIGL